ncbi:protein containing DUF1566, partial [Candidatus Magnetomorum sp. HK-1]
NKKKTKVQDILNQMKVLAWLSNFSIKSDTSDIFVQIVHNVTTKHMHDSTKPIYSIFMHCWLTKNFSTKHDLQQFSQSIKTYAGIDNWRVPTIEELIRIFQLSKMSQSTNPMKQNIPYQFWSSTPANSNKKFWMLTVQWNKKNILFLDIDKASTNNNARMLIVSDSK